MDLPSGETCGSATERIRQIASEERQFCPASKVNTEKNTRPSPSRSEEHTSELQSQSNLVCRLLLEKKKQQTPHNQHTPLYINHENPDFRSPARNNKYVRRDLQLNNTCHISQKTVQLPTSDTAATTP